MTHVFTQTRKPALGREKRAPGTLAISSYTASGEVILAADAKLRGTLVDLDVQDGVSTTGHIWRFDRATKKVRAYKPNKGGLVTDIFPDVLGGVFASALTDQASAGVGVSAIHAGIAGDDATFTGAGVTTAFTQPDYPRSVNVGITSVGGATAIAGSVRVTGTAMDGTAQTEDVVVPPGAIAAGKFRNRVGTKVFATITNFKCLTAQPTDIVISLGLGTIFGLTATISAAGDVKKVQKNTAKVASSTYTASATTNSVNLGANLADNDEVLIEYDGVASSLVDREAAAAEDVGTCRVEAIVQ